VVERRLTGSDFGLTLPMIILAKAGIQGRKFHWSPGFRLIICGVKFEKAKARPGTVDCHAALEGVHACQTGLQLGPRAA
jgi:hypothetical protein